MSDVQLPKLQVQRNRVSVPTETRIEPSGGDSAGQQDSVSLSHGLGERDGYRALSGRQMREALDLVMHGRAPAEPSKQERLALLNRMVQADYAQFLQGR
jgi:hypothetical protein